MSKGYIVSPLSIQENPCLVRAKNIYTKTSQMEIYVYSIPRFQLILQNVWIFITTHFDTKFNDVF